MRFDGLKITALALLVLTADVVLAADENDVLYWMVDGNATVTTDTESGSTATIGDFFKNITKYSPFENLNTGEGSVFAARIRVTGGGIQKGQDVFLDLYNADGSVDMGNGRYGVDFYDGSGYWGAGVPTGNQSPSGNYSSGTPEYSFIVELGNIDSDDNWTTVATSAAATYSSLGTYIHEKFDVAPSSLAAWTPTQFTIAPEPSSGLLALMGFAILALRRKQKEV